MTYLEALELLVRESGWPRKEVERDPTSAAWFVAQSQKNPGKQAEAQHAGTVVAKGKP